jgi:hypothetical protein
VVTRKRWNSHSEYQ